MNKGTFFIMLTTQNGDYTPLMSEDGYDIAKYPTKEAAIKSAKNNVLGCNFGFEIFEKGCGE
jgi:hypothetical protein